LRAVWNGADSANVYMDHSAEQAATAATSSSFPGTTVAGSPVSSSGSFLESGSSSASVPGGSEDIAKSIMGVDIDYVKIYETAISKTVNYLNYIFEPVQHSFALDVMSNHVQNISILLFILTVIIFIFFISLLFNITTFIFSDRLLSYFKNKYIIGYIKYNKKIIAFEIIMLSG
jgi:hypothetical protein